MDSYDLHGIGFFDENELESLFIFDYLFFLSRVMAVCFPSSEMGVPGDFIGARNFIHNCLNG
jgi:hypothetical protein